MNVNAPSSSSPIAGAQAGTLRVRARDHGGFALTCRPLHALLMAVVLLAPGVPAGRAHAETAVADSLAVDARAKSAGTDSLAMSSGVPWNPPRALARRRPWEQAALLPGRVISLPLAGLGALSEVVLFRVEQDPRLANGATPWPGTAGHAVVLRTARMGDRTGLGGAVEVHERLLRGALASTVSAEYAATLHHYDRTLLAWTGRPLSIQYGYEWRPGDRFYGVGNGAPASGVSDYASQSEFVRAGLAWQTNPATDPSYTHSAFGVWAGPRSTITRNGRAPGDVSYAARFPELGAATLDRRVENLTYGARVLLDRRTGAPHWSGGWRTQLSAERFGAPVHALALRSAAGDGARFERYQAQADAGVSFMRDPRTLRLSLRVTDQRVDSNRDRLLLADLATLGGQAGLSGYDPGRFHDLDLLLTRLDYVFPLQRMFEMDLHSEWGAVYPDVWHDAKPNTLHSSFGFELRVRSDARPRAAIGCDFSRESIRLRYSIGGLE